MPFKIKFSSNLLIGLLIVLFFAVALFMRVYFPYDKVFVDDWIKFTSNDAYYQMRLIDNMAYNFPHFTSFDPYLLYPGGGAYGGAVFFNWLVALVIWIFTGGSPTPHAIDVISVYFPAVLAALTVIPAYFIGKALFNRWAGVIAAAIISVLPGEFIGRSILGGMDKPAIEILLTSVAAMFLILAVKEGWQNRLSRDLLVKRDWKKFIKPLFYSLLSGFFLGLYLITWIGALLFVFIFAAYFIVQFIIDRLKGQSSFYLGFTGFFTFLAAFIVFQPVAGGSFYTLSLIIAILIPPVLAAISAIMSGRGLKPYFYPVILVVIGGAFLGVFYLVKPDMLNTLFSLFSIFHPGGPTGTTTIEMQPFLAPQGAFTTLVAWGNFTTSFFLVPGWPVPGIAIIALFFIVWFFTRQQNDAKQQIPLRIGTLAALALTIIFLFAWSVTDAATLLVFTVLAALAFIVMLLMLTANQRSDDKHLMLFFIWTIIILFATLTQRRFAYYLVVNIALLSGYLGWQFIRQALDWRRNTQNPETLTEQYKRTRLIGIVGGVIAFGVSFALTGVQYLFVPVLILGWISILYGFWSWARLKGKNDYMMLWAFVFPIGILAIAFSRDESAKTKTKAKTVEKTNPWLRRFSTATLVILVFLAVFYPNYIKAKTVAAAASYAPDNAWEETMHWMKDNTPDPLPAEDYYALLDSSYAYPDSAYAVTAWWDYGYWIMRTAHRLPSANPSQSPEPIKKVANLFLSQDDATTGGLMAELDSSYVILDNTMTITKLWAVATWAGQDQYKYMDTYYYPVEDSYELVQVFTEEYYSLLSVRLYNFDGKASTSEHPLVLTYENMADKSGSVHRVIKNVEEFNSYLSAVNYIESRENSGNMVIIGSSPFSNPVPVQAVSDFELVFNSTDKVSTSDNTTMPEIKVFKYLGN